MSLAADKELVKANGADLAAAAVLQDRACKAGFAWQHATELDGHAALRHVRQRSRQRLCVHESAAVEVGKQRAQSAVTACGQLGLAIPDERT